MHQHRSHSLLIPSRSPGLRVPSSRETGVLRAGPWDAELGGWPAPNFPRELSLGGLLLTVNRSGKERTLL